ncbi:MAG TPA: hypothetical protein PKE54_09130, partial [Candidatus Obscuribacter sp.]|nr:hypothetical protein [Candidatus Obscuribacter sp.]
PQVFNTIGNFFDASRPTLLCPLGKRRVPILPSAAQFSLAIQAMAGKALLGKLRLDYSMFRHVG